jgi:rubrerythrin
MGLLGAFESMLGGGSSPTTVYECRQCGTTLDGRDNCCPACGGTHVAEYEIG